MNIRLLLCFALCSWCFSLTAQEATGQQKLSDLNTKYAVPTLYGNALWSENGYFEGLTSGMEQMGKRSLVSKNFKVNDTTHQVFLGQWHYKAADGSIKDIDLDIKPSNNNAQSKYENTENLFKSYFGSSLNDGIVVSKDDLGITFGKQPVITTGNNQYDLSNYTPSTSNNFIQYEDATGNIAIQYQLEERTIHHLNIIQNNIFQNETGNILFSEEMELPIGTYLATEDGSRITNIQTIKGHIYLRKGDEIIATFVQPKVWDDAFVGLPHDTFENNAEGTLLMLDTKIEILKGNKIRYSIVLPADWINDTNRTFPIYVDPTITFGSGSFTTYYQYPWKTDYKLRMSEILIRNSYLGQSGNITDVAFLQTQNNSYSNQGATIKMKTVSYNAISNENWESGLTTCKSGTFYFTSGASSSGTWKNISLSNNYSYTYGSSNHLLIQTRFYNSNTGSSGGTKSWSAPYNAHLRGFNTSSSNPSSSWSSFGTQTPYLKIELSTSSGQPNLTYNSSNNSLSVSGTTVNIGMRVENQGTASTGTNSYVGYYLSTNSTITTSDYLIGTDYVGNLSAGQGGNESFSIDVTNVSPSIPAGTYYVGYLIDYQGVISESNENDNRYYWSSSSQKVTIGGGSTSSDITVTNGTIDVNTVQAGNTIYVTCDQNYSGNSTSISNPDVGYYLSTNCSLSSSDVLLGSDWSSINANDLSDPESETLTIPSNTLAGTYYILFVADYLNEVSESNENNNIQCIGTLTVTVSSSSDITVTNGTIDVNSVQAGNSIYVTCDQNYSGNSTSISNPDVGYYLSTNCSLSSSDVLLGSDWSSINANDLSDPESETLTIPSNTSAGTYYILFVADYLNEVSESNENNNIQCVGTLTVTVPVNNDVYATNPNLSLSVVRIGETTLASCTQNYNGNSSATINSEIGYYLSTNTTFDGADIYLEDDNSTLSTSAPIENENQTVTIPTWTTPGDYYILMVADHDGQVSETNENNNTVYKSIKVLPNNSLIISNPPTNSVSVNSPVNQNPGDPVDVATGAFTWMQLDMSLSGRNGDYALVRYYNSQDSYNGSMGYGWSHSFDIHLTVNGNNWTVKHGDGHSDYYYHYNDGSTLPMYPGVTDTMYQSASNYILEKDNGIKYTFNSSGVLQNITDRNSNTTSFTYASGNLSKVTFPGGRYFDFAYSGSRISTITDNDNSSVSYTYDGNGDMTQFTDMDNGVYQYAYTNHEMISVKDPKVNTIIQNTYISNKVTQQVDAAGGIFTFQYNMPVANACTVTDAESGTAIYYHDEAYRLIKKTDELGNNSLFEFNENNQFTKITNENNDVVNISHDYKGNVIEIDAPLNTKTSSTYNAQNVPNTITNAANKDINVTYDANANPINMAFPNGSSLTSTYNSNGQLLTQTDGNGNQISFQYNNVTGDLSSITTSTGTYNFGYDNLGRITSVTDRNGKQTQMQLDKFGNITKVTDPMGYFIDLTYDANGNILTFKDKNGATTDFTYDNKDRMIKVTDGEGNETNFTYDLMDRLKTVTDAESRTVNYAYDNKGRMISYTTALGTYTFGYDNVGNRTSVTDALNNTTTITYDKLNRPISIENALNETVYMTYNALGQVKTFQDAGGNITTYDYNNMGWLTKVQDAASGENNFTYDPNGNMLTFNDANGNTTTMTYNDQNLPITQLNGASHLTKMYYDNEGNLIGKVDANGDSTGLVLNDNYLVTQLVFSNGNNYQYVYDNNGALSSMTNANGTTSFTRNLLGAITQTQDPFGNITKFIYDKVGNRTGTIYSGTDTVNIEYNAANLPTKVKDWAGNYSNRTYDANGALTNVSNSNGTYTNIVRDALGRVETYANFQPGNVLINSDTLTYNNIGNITRRGRHQQLSPTFANLTDSYTHGNDNRLTATSNGNVTNDDNGAWTNNGQGETYTWGENSLLKSYTINGVTTQNYHDAGRNLIKEVKSGVETRYQLDNTNSLSQVLRKLDDQNNVTASYIHAPDGLAWRLDDQGNAQFFAYDYLGHTNALTDENGNITDTYASDPFGDFANHIGNTVQPFQFLGKYGIQHKGNGHYHIRARDYSGSTGTFISPDAYPMNFASTQLVNKYAYAVNNSMSFMDVDGFKPSSVINKIEDVLGGIGTIGDALYDKDNNFWLGINRNSKSLKFYDFKFGGGTRGRIIGRNTIETASNYLKGAGVLGDIIGVVDIGATCVANTSCKNEILDFATDVAIGAGVAALTVATLPATATAGVVATAVIGTAIVTDLALNSSVGKEVKQQFHSVIEPVTTPIYNYAEPIVKNIYNSINSGVTNLVNRIKFW